MSAGTLNLNRVAHADCRVFLASLPAESVSACVCDPPYELGFMGKKWDNSGIAYDVAMWGEVLRVLKPGGHLLAFGGTRTHHRMVCAIEDAGFEIRDEIQWLYGTGFPKSLDIGKALDKAAGAEREVVSERETGWSGTLGGNGAWSGLGNAPDVRRITAPATEEAKRWDGWGTALKPACEPICVARKPLIGTVAANVLLHGTGGINVDGGRVGNTKRVPGGISGTISTTDGRVYSGGWGQKSGMESGNNPNIGRWPANVMLTHAPGCECVGTKRVKGAHHVGKTEGDYSYGQKGQVPSDKPFSIVDPDGLETVEAWQCVAGCPVKVLDEQSGETVSKANMRGLQHSGRHAGLGDFGGNIKEGTNTLRGHSDTGGASRFFYCAKASRKERGVTNTHATVKPLKLMRYLVQLVTPPGGVLLDPFAGSGTTLLAAQQLGFPFLGCEREAEHIAIIHARLGLELPFANAAAAPPSPDSCPLSPVS